MKTNINIELDKKDNKELTKILQPLGVDDELKQYFNDKELNSASKELEYMENHLDEYKSYDNVTELINDLDND